MVPIFVFVPVFVHVLVLVLQQAATYSIAAVAGNWTILVLLLLLHVVFPLYLYWQLISQKTTRHVHQTIHRHPQNNPSLCSAPPCSVSSLTLTLWSYKLVFVIMIYDYDVTVYVPWLSSAAVGCESLSVSNVSSLLQLQHFTQLNTHYISALQLSVVGPETDPQWLRTLFLLLLLLLFMGFLLLSDFQFPKALSFLNRS